MLLFQNDAVLKRFALLFNPRLNTIRNFRNACRLNAVRIFLNGMKFGKGFCRFVGTRFGNQLGTFDAVRFFRLAAVLRCGCPEP